MTRKFVSVILAVLLCVSLAVSASAATTEFLYDDADLLTAAEEQLLSEKLANYSSAYNTQFVVVTAKSIDRNIDQYLDYLYDSRGFGYGQTREGVLLLVCMDIREYRILSNGYAGDAISPDDIDDICDVIVSDLSDGDYAEAFTKFADECAYYLNGYINGYPFATGKNLAISLAIGIAVGLVVVLILRGQLKSVRKQNQADQYSKVGSLNLTAKSDLFLYRNVTRRKRESSSSSGGGSRGGGSRSTGGGKF